MMCGKGRRVSWGWHGCCSKTEVGVMTRLEANDGEAGRCRTDDSEKSLSVARAGWEQRCGGVDDSEFSEEQETMCKVSIT
jgi:hypothetical protein